MYVHVLDGLGNVTILSSDDFLDGALCANVMSGGGWIVGKSHNGPEDPGILGGRWAHSPASPTPSTMALGLFSRHAAF